MERDEAINSRLSNLTAAGQKRAYVEVNRLLCGEACFETLRNMHNRIVLALPPETRENLTTIVQIFNHGTDYSGTIIFTGRSINDEGYLSRGVF